MCVCVSVHVCAGVWTVYVHVTFNIHSPTDVISSSYNTWKVMLYDALQVRIHSSSPIQLGHA